VNPTLKQSAGETGSLDSVERLLDFMPGCMKLFSAGGPASEAYFI
jgi:hypothetical protein